MISSQVIAKVLEIDRLARESVGQFSFKRDLFKKLASEPSRLFKAIIGPRGVGKTVLLQQILVETKDSIYISADSLEPDLDLFALVKTLNKNYGFKSCFIDEIFFNHNYQKALKNIFDFLDVRIFFTSSTALSLIKSSYDLSRRVALYELHLFPFWEYLCVKGVEVAPLHWDQLVQKNIPPSHHRYISYFEDYIKGGALPYSLHGGDIIQGQKAVIVTILEKDIPHVYPVTTEDIFYLKKVVEFVAESSPDGVNYSSLSQNLGVTKYKAQQYTNILAKAFVLNISTPHGTNVSKEPKILMYLPNRLIYTPYEKGLGGLREDFATTMFRYLGLEYSYLKTTKGKKTPDFLLEHKGQKIVCEIGGQGKGYGQFKDLDNYDIKLVFKHGDSIKKEDLPLFLLGLCVP